MLLSPSAVLSNDQRPIDIDYCRLQGDERRVWDEYVLRCSESNHCHLSGWARVIERSYGHQSHYLWAQRAGNVSGVLPLISMRSLLFRRALVSMPFLDDGGICADDDFVKERLAQEALRIREGRKADFLDLRHRFPSGLDLPNVGQKIVMMLDLVADTDIMWKGFDAKLRNQTRKAAKSGLAATWSARDGLAEFYDVFAANMRDLGSPVHSRMFFDAIFDEFSDSAKLMLVRKDEQVIGGAVCLLFKDTMIVPWASSLREYFTLCPNNLLYWEMIRWGCESGYRRFDFGRSSPDSGTYRFKRQWGAREEPLHWQCVSPQLSDSVASQADSDKYHWAAKAWSALPLFLTKLVGPCLRGRISN